MDAAEWLESAEEANKRTVVDRSSYGRPSSSLTEKNTDATAARTVATKTARMVATKTARMVVRPTARKEKGVIRFVHNPKELALSALPGHSQLILVMYISLK